MSAQVPLVLQNSVDSPISVFPISISTKCAILKEFWGFTVPQSQADNILREFDAYFAYYQEECRLAQMYIGSSGYLSTRTHRDICGIVKYLRQGMARDIIRTTLITELPPPVPTDAEQLVDNSIDLAASLLLMLQFDQHGRVFPLRNYLSWRSGTLRDFLWSTFPLSTGQRESIRLHKGFTARNFERKARIRVCWTNNLADHLRFEDWGEPRVFIFPYATILRLHQDL
jgi:hypothetical protein